MEKITIVVTYDDVNAYFLAIDRNTGRELSREEHWMWDGVFDEDETLEKIAKSYNCENYTVIHW